MPDSALRIQGEQGAKFRLGLFDGTLRQEQTGEAELQLRVIRVSSGVPAKPLDFPLAALHRSKNGGFDHARLFPRSANSRRPDFLKLIQKLPRLSFAAQFHQGAAQVHHGFRIVRGDRDCPPEYFLGVGGTVQGDVSRAELVERTNIPRRDLDGFQKMGNGFRRAAEAIEEPRQVDVCLRHARRQAQGLRQLVQGLLGMIAPGELCQIVIAQGIIGVLLDVPGQFLQPFRQAGDGVPVD